MLWIEAIEPGLTGTFYSLMISIESGFSLDRQFGISGGDIEYFASKSRVVNGDWDIPHPPEVDSG